MFARAGIPDGHAHRLRDTFAVELLNEGVPIESVTVLLGHRSKAVTEKHYAPWVKERQDIVEQHVMKTWKKRDKEKVMGSAPTPARTRTAARPCRRAGALSR
jgi:integrase